MSYVALPRQQKYCVSPNKNIYLPKKVYEGLYIILYNSTLKPHWSYQ